MRAFQGREPGGRRGFTLNGGLAACKAAGVWRKRWGVARMGQHRQLAARRDQVLCAKPW